MMMSVGCVALQKQHETHHILGNQPTGVIYESAGFCETQWASLESNATACEEGCEEPHDVNMYFTDESIPVDRPDD